MAARPPDDAAALWAGTMGPEYEWPSRHIVARWYGPRITTRVRGRASVVEFPTGRYELRGDGITEPYRWVWIPKPPTAPPAEPPSPVPPTSGEAGPTRHAPLYRWTDEQGTLHYTDRLTAVPDRYRAKARRGEPS